ncbi:hypothetical protein I551_3619 [Mycobacterium ulcerans str. Harvey]|uniref:Uncharacterized protein n=1 Tax=Mycobacterium ulcerans str. Harvey TaxID=1299332 RepID=A0ABP3AG21_MYCUL|nr:hypothetical protein I551_3619 [Mycobacterium ulcerans str. Harvey]
MSGSARISETKFLPCGKWAFVIAELATRIGVHGGRLHWE